jgi:glycosyltransferase involved in cell wall biosynthesis
MDSPKRILLINQYFAPSEAATAVLLRELVEDLAPTMRVTVFCETAAGPGEPSASYQVERRPIPSWIPEKKVVASKALRWMSSFLFMVRTLFFLVASKPYDLVVFASEPPFIDLVGGLLCWCLKRRFVIVTQDLYPEFAEGARLQPVALFAWPLKKLHSFVARRARRVIAVSPDHVELLARRGVETHTIIPNWAPSSVANTDPVPMPSADGTMIIQYAGNLGLACDLDALEVALQELSSKGELARFYFILRGDGIKREQARRIAARYENVVYQAPVARDEVFAAMAACHAHLILTPARLFGCVYASKANSIMAAARPIIASVPDGSSLTRFISSQRVGYVSPAEDPSQLASCILKALRDLGDNPSVLSEMGARGWRYVSQEWNRAKATGRYEAEFQTVLNEDL